MVDGPQNDGLIRSEGVGDAFVLDRSRDDIALWKTPTAERRLELFDADSVEKPYIGSPLQQHSSDERHDLIELRAVDDLPPRTLRQCEV
ncbi:Uncharacterised protein [Mycobacteroides abscessus subsp. abscessus]|nr:Uncharacterised protein [Mycobacteroides abscessus subsp. abscessus]